MTDALSAFVYGSPPLVVAAALLTVGLAVALGCLVLVRRFVEVEARRRHVELVSVSVANVALLHSVLLAFLAIAVWEEFREAARDTSREAGLIRRLHHGIDTLPAASRDDLRPLVADHLERIVRFEWPAMASARPVGATTPVIEALRRGIAGLPVTTEEERRQVADLRMGLDDVQATRANRLTERGGRIPTLVWTLIALLGLLTIALSALLPAERFATQIAMLGGTAAAITIVMLMIVELDHPFRGSVSISDAPYREVLQEIIVDSRSGQAIYFIKDRMQSSAL